MNTLPAIDLIILAVYLLGVVGFGCWFVRRSGTTDEFMAAGRSLPGWAVGLSIFGTFLSSNTFIGVPGKAVSGNWNFFVFSLSIPIAAWIAAKVFVPFYRRSGEISAYHHLETRFGPWARSYAMVCYLLTQIARTATILFGVSLALTELTGWPQIWVIVLAGALITIYTVLGGIEAVIWTDVVQSIVLSVGAVLVLILILQGMPGGISQMRAIAQANEKFSLGSWGSSLTESTFWIVLIYGVFINLNNFGIDQSFVQRYHTAKNDREAVKSVWLGAWLYLPVSAVFFFIGTALFSYYTVHPDSMDGMKQQIAIEKLNAENEVVNDQTLQQAADQVTVAELGDHAFPHFIVAQLPPGVSGLLIAALLAAAMSSVDTSLNSSATILLSDFYRRYFNPTANERQSMAVLYTATIMMGCIGTASAVMMIGTESILATWWKLSGIFAGGMLGLFLLGVFARLSDRRGALWGVTVGVCVISWLSLSPWLEQSGIVPGWLVNHLHSNLTIVLGTLTIFGVGVGVSRWYAGPSAKDQSLQRKEPRL